MTATDEDALRGRFDAESGVNGALSLVGGAPVDAVIRRGRALRGRRRVGAAGGSALLVAAAVAVPGLGLWPGTGSPVTAGSAQTHEVVVNQLGPNALGNVIGTGKIDGQDWTVVALPIGLQQPNKPPCFSVNTAVPVDGGTTILCSPTMQPGVPIDFRTQSAIPYSVGNSNDYQWYAIGVVRSDVTKVVAVLEDGEVLTLPVVSLNGVRYVVLGGPKGVGLTRIGAFNASGAVVGDVLPYNQSSGYPQLLTWYKPGQAPAMMPGTALIGSGVKSSGEHWMVTADLGPFGVCFPSSWLVAGDPPCGPAAQPGNSAFVLYGLSNGGGVFEFGGANAHLDHAVVTFTDGESVTIRPVVVEGRAFAAFLLPDDHRGSVVPIQTVVSYDSSGKQLAQQNNPVEIYY